MLAALALAGQAPAQDRARYEKMIAKHAKANLVPEALVHRLIVRESKYNPELIGHGGTIGLMQIKLATAKGVGYSGDADGLRDPETNLAYGVKYLAGAYRAAGGDYDRAIRYFAGGYYYVARQQRLERLKQGKADFSAAPPKIAKVEEKPAPPARKSRLRTMLQRPQNRQTGRRRRHETGEAPLKLVPVAAKPAHAAQAQSCEEKACRRQAGPGSTSAGRDTQRCKRRQAALTRGIIGLH